MLREREALKKDLNDSYLAEMAIPREGLLSYICKPKIQLKKLSVFLKEAGALDEAKINIMENKSILRMQTNNVVPKTNVDLTEMYERFGKHYYYLVGLLYVPQGIVSGFFKDSENYFIFFNEYKPFVGNNKTGLMRAVAAGDIKKQTKNQTENQTEISTEILDTYYLASIVFPIEEV